MVRTQKLTANEIEVGSETESEVVSNNTETQLEH